MYEKRLIVLGAVAAAALALGAGVAQAATSGSITGFTVDPKATLSSDRTQESVTGTITCLSGESVFLSSQVSEVVGRLQRTASGAGSVSCTGASQSWSVTFSSGTGLPLLPGPANISVIAMDMNFSHFGSGSFVGTVLLTH